ncbi:MAG: amino acid transporter [Desulfocapsa sp.]|nr:MAG: amino acid transporter [Desulfocapsa sp.]
MEHAFRHPNISGMGGWLLLIGYIGTMALYSFTFGVYGSEILGSTVHGGLLHHLLESSIMLTFLGINLYGVKASGSSELIIVSVKMLILFLFGGIGLLYARPDHLLPVFNQGYGGVFMGAALIFVAYEGFELIPNAANEMMDPEHNLHRGIVFSIVITIAVYILVSLVAVGNLLPEQVIKYKEYALAVAARPFLGHAGFLLIGLAALFSTASAINATLFGTARLGMVMATEKVLPAVFSFRRKQNNIPWVSLVAITVLTIVFVNLADLTIISSFASSTFLLIFAAINLSALRLRTRIEASVAVAITGLSCSLASWLALLVYLFQVNRSCLHWIGGLYLAVFCAEVLFSKRRWIMRELEELESK